MFVAPSVQSPEKTPASARLLAAIVYENEVYPDTLMPALVAHCRASGLSIAGVLQHRASACDEHRCDIFLEDLRTGQRTAIFEQRGAGATGCKLDTSALTEVAARIEGNMGDLPDVLILNKFGKAECEGGGLLDLIGMAIDAGVKVIIAVPKRNLAAWRNFAGDFSDEFADDLGKLLHWLKISMD
jgi:hypothetical protein